MGNTLEIIPSTKAQVLQAIHKIYICILRKKDEWSVCPHIKVIANSSIGEISLTEAYMHPRNNISTMRFPQEKKHIKGNEHNKIQGTKRDLLELRVYDLN